MDLIDAYGYRLINGVDKNVFLDEINDFSGMITQSFDTLLGHVDAVYLFSTPEMHYEQIKKALTAEGLKLIQP